jgi:large conductance mechanosensitive channel
MLNEFKQFLFRGNIIDLAVAFVMGIAFVAVVNALVADLLTPVIAAIIGKPDFGALHFTINGSVFRYGDFLNAVIAFVSVAAVVFFAIVKPAGLMIARLAPAGDEPAVRSCPECLSTIPAAARRCASCTAAVTPTAVDSRP